MTDPASPTTILHPDSDEGGYCVSLARNGWMPGFYADLATALHAARVADESILSRLQNSVHEREADVRRRVITRAMIDAESPRLTDLEPASIQGRHRGQWVERWTEGDPVPAWALPAEPAPGTPSQRPVGDPELAIALRDAPWNVPGYLDHTTELLGTSEGSMPLKSIDPKAYRALCTDTETARAKRLLDSGIAMALGRGVAAAELGRNGSAMLRTIRMIIQLLGMKLGMKPAPPIVVEAFGPPDGDDLPCFMIFKRPASHPESFVVMEHRFVKGRLHMATVPLAVAATLEEARASLGADCIRIENSRSDSAFMETWI